MKPIADVRQFAPQDWALYKRLRLQELQRDQNLFSIKYEVEAAYADDLWLADLTDPDFGIFGVYTAGFPVGMTGILVDRKKDPSGNTAKLWGSWLEPEWRGKGFSEAMYKARLDWARAHPTVTRVTVSHRAGNAASKAANQKHGFTYTHTADYLWPDGTTDAEVFYELRVKE